MNSAPLKASVAKGVRNKVVEIYPEMEEYIDTLWPKTAKVLQLKPKGVSHVHFLRVDDRVCFIDIKGK